jgi:hypothetical protein
MVTKFFKLKPEEIVELITPMGACFATDRITVDGMKIGYMYREEAEEEMDSGWRFFEGSESDEYANDPNNVMIYAVNTIANYDPAIIPYLDLPCFTELVRIEGTDQFQILPQ